MKQSHFQPSCTPIMFAASLLLVSLVVIESRFLVKTLPGFVGDLPFMLETGYIGVGESNDVQLFYYFIESEGNPKDDPLILWLTGGPGCSALSALFYEIGPLAINYGNSTLEKTILEIKPHSWTKVASIVFLDQPAGSGFSYARTPEGYIVNDTLSAMQTYQFLRKWLVDHPKFLKNPFYLGGDSYSGIVLPMVVHEIYNGIGVGEWPQINIKGYVLGNPFTDTSSEYNSRIPFAHHMALLSDAIYKSTKESCGGEYVNVDPSNNMCIRDLQVVEKEGACDLLTRPLWMLGRYLSFRCIGVERAPIYIPPFGLIAEMCEKLFTFVRNLTILSGYDAIKPCFLIFVRNPYLTHTMSQVP